jgi:hypothetical protein
MNTLFDVAGLAIVAYVEVLADGTSASTNSGVTTTKTGSGQYDIILPANKAQSNSRDLIFVQPKHTPLTSTPITDAVDDSDATTKHVALYAGSPLATFADSDFSFILLRTIVPPPAGSPA